MDRTELRRGLSRLLFADTGDWASPHARLRLQAGADGVKIATSTGEVWSETSLDARVEEDGEMLLASRPILAFLDKVHDRDVRLVRKAESAVFTSGRVKMSLGCVSMDQWYEPRTTGDPSRFMLPAELVRRVPNMLIAAHKTDPVLKGVRCGDGHLVASDHYRLSMVSCSPDLPEFVVGAHVWRHLARVADGVVGLNVDKSNIRFSLQPATSILALRITGSYPDVARVVPTTFESHLNFDRQELTMAVEATAYIDFQGRVVRITHKGSGHADISSSHPKIGSVVERVGVSGNYVGTLRFDAISLVDILKHLEEDKVSMGIVGPERPVVVSENALTHVIIPFAR